MFGDISLINLKACFVDMNYGNNHLTSRFLRNLRYQ